MPKMNGSGPEGKGSKTGRGIGRCKDTPGKDISEKIGKGLGMRRKSGGGEGMGKRLKYDS